MLKRLQPYISLITPFLHILFLSLLLLPASSQTLQCPKTDVFLEWSGSRREWVPKCSTELPSSTSTSPSVPPGAACQTPACNAFSARVLSALDPSVEPCQDFYKFACGKYNATNAIQMHGAIILDQMNGILKEPANITKEPWEENIR